MACRISYTGLNKIDAPEYCLDSRYQFSRAIRLAEIIVGPQFQTNQAVDFLDTRRGHNDGYIRKGTRLIADFQTVPAGEHKVQHHQIRLMLPHPWNDFTTIVQPLGFITRFREVFHHYLGELWLILNNQYGSVFH